MARILVPTLGLLALVVLGVAAYAVVVWVNRRNEFQRQADEIRLASMRKQAELEALLLERQHTWSLEDIARHRARLEGDLDKLHEDRRGS